ncbi:hypothetical protein AGMMS49983_01940 [Clostridia bacterium]|nr:hypothetical protein AGMMS49983_01940 [Clostridia bacterium]
MPLTLARPQDGAMIICKVGGKDETRKHLAELGFVAGEKVQIICEAAGNLILNVKGARIALDRQLAQRIMV